VQPCECSKLHVLILLGLSACWLLVLLQAAELEAARAAAEEGAAQAAVTSALVSALQADKTSLAQQVKKLTADRSSLQEQLGSSAGDIDMLQVGAVVWLSNAVARAPRR